MFYKQINFFAYTKGTMVFERNDEADVRRRFETYGFVLPDNFHYVNTRTPITGVYDRVERRYRTISNMYLTTLINQRGRQPYVEETPLDNTLVPQGPAQPLPPLRILQRGGDIHFETRRERDSFDRWLNNQSNEVQQMSFDDQQITYTTMQSMLRQFSRRTPFNINFDEENSTKIAQLTGLVEAMRVAGPRLNMLDVRLTFLDDQGNPIDYRHLNPNTIQCLHEVMNNYETDRIKDSTDDIIDSILSANAIHIDFVRRQAGRRIVGGFFPFINKSDIDLRRYGIFDDSAIGRGIFSNIDDCEINDSCLIQAFRYSGILSDDEMKMLISFTKTRQVPQTEFKLIAELFNIQIRCKILYDNNQVSHEKWGMENADRSLDLFIYKGHYMLNEYTNVAECYIKRYDEIHRDARFRTHPRKMMLQKFDDNRYSFAKLGLHITKLVQAMIEANLLVAMDDKTYNKINWSFIPKVIDFEGTAEPIIVKDKTLSKFKMNNRLDQGKRFFGYKPEPEEVTLRLRELQHVINQIPLRNKIDVSLYYKFSELMQKIMYEFGCFDDVYKFSGLKAKNIRDECIFPKIRTYNDKPLYLKQKLYYVDLNGAYMAAVKDIPTGTNLDGKNTRIKELIEILYAARLKAKQESNDKLATTLKFMMTSCWGYSIQRPKIVKHKYCKNVDNYIATFAPFVIKHKYSDDGVSGYVDTVNPFVPHFSFPQFAKSVLDEFRRMINEVKQVVNVLYENIDAILVTEEDYHKLVELGYIGDKLGQFKIEHIFTEIAIKSQRVYVATLDTGDKYYHCVKKDVDYNSFVGAVKKMC